MQWRKSGKTYHGLPVGRYQVMLIPAGGGDVDHLSAEEMLAGGDKQATAGSQTIPAQYMRAATSGIELTISEGANQFDIDV